MVPKNTCMLYNDIVAHFWVQMWDVICVNLSYFTWNDHKKKGLYKKNPRVPRLTCQATLRNTKLVAPVFYWMITWRQLVWLFTFLISFRIAGSKNKLSCFAHISGDTFSFNFFSGNFWFSSRHLTSKPGIYSVFVHQGSILCSYTRDLFCHC